MLSLLVSAVDIRLCAAGVLVDPVDGFPETDRDNVDGLRLNDGVLEATLANDVRALGVGGPISVNRAAFMVDGGAVLVDEDKPLFARELFPNVNGFGTDGVSKCLGSFAESDNAEEGRMDGVLKSDDSRRFVVLEGGAGVLPAVPRTPIFRFIYKVHP